jgi:hypothetical protein
MLLAYEPAKVPTPRALWRRIGPPNYHLLHPMESALRHVGALVPTDAHYPAATVFLSSSRYTA